jgi:16S rRNA (guanine(966)-N(2))-methyltransferase RsmD
MARRVREGRVPCGSVRIIAGRWRGRRVDVPGGGSVRPTGERAREALFSILGSRIVDARVLDLYCGTGIVGLEALSRGARRVLAVDGQSRVVASLRATAAAFGATLEEHVSVRADVSRFLKTAPIAEPFDLVFADPPWGSGASAEVLRLVSRRPWLVAGGLLILERDAERSVPEQPEPSFTLSRRARYGRIVFDLLERSDET